MTARPIDPAGDIAALRTLKFDDDARTIDEMIAEDEHDDVRVESVQPHDDGETFTVCWDGGTCTSVSGAQPSVGDTIRFYGSASLGGSHHGWALNSQVIAWKTPWERFADRVRWLADYDRRKREDFARRHAELDEKYAALPAPLKARIDRFRRESPTFRIESEAYEMAAVGDAPKIAKAIAGREGWNLDDDLRVTTDGVPRDAIREVVQAFYDLGYEEQKAIVPDLDAGHSGNTFGGAVHLAAGLLTGEIAEHEQAERNGTAASS